MLFSNIRRTRFDQSSPVQPVSDFRGGSTSVTEKEDEVWTEILVTNIGRLIETNSGRVAEGH